MYPKMKNILFVVTNIFEILGILSCLFIYSFIIFTMPVNSAFTFKVISPVVLLFLLTGLSYYNLSRFYPIEEKRVFFSILEVAVILFSFFFILLFNFLGSLIMFISIINLAFYLILLCEVIIYFVNKCQNIKRE